MKIVCIDETGVAGKGLFALSAVMIDATKYGLIASHFEKTLAAAKWSPSHEFKGKFVFSSTQGDTAVTVEQRVEMVSALFQQFNAKSNSRIKAVLAWNLEGETPENYRHLLGHAIHALGIPRRGGKNLVVVVCDKWDRLSYDDLSASVRAAVEGAGGRIVEDVLRLTSKRHHTGIALADIIGYFLAWQINNPTLDNLFPGSTLPQKKALIDGWCESLKAVERRKALAGAAPSQKRKAKKRARKV